MSATTRAKRSESRDWRQLASLGEQLVSANSLDAQRDRIISVTERLINGKIDVWLNEALFRLPDWDEKRLFPAQPALDGMRRAVQRKKLTVHKTAKKSASLRTFAALPLEDHGFILGALQVTRPRGPNFTKEEQTLLEGLARIVGVGLYAAHRVEVERFRLGQLNLVRQVSAQIANVLEIDELSRRVTDLIQKTFHFYYVAIFTLKKDLSALVFSLQRRCAA